MIIFHFFLRHIKYCFPVPHHLYGFSHLSRVFINIKNIKLLLFLIKFDRKNIKMYIRQIKFILFETINFLIALYFNKLFGDSFCGVVWEMKFHLRTSFKVIYFHFCRENCFAFQSLNETTL
jgi:hypothetical protein